MRVLVGLLGSSVLATAALAAEPATPAVRPALESAGLPDNSFESDADDPAIWVDPKDKAKSLVVVAVKDGGIRVLSLKGKTLQTIDPVETADGTGRINNVDVAYGLKLQGGKSVDVVVATDRALDIIRVYRIDGGTKRPLVEITDPKAGRAFPTRPKLNGKGSQANPVLDQNTAYGLALYKAPGGEITAVATQRGQARIGFFRLVAGKGGLVAPTFTRDVRFPVVHDGQNLRQESEDDPARDWSPQLEGMVVDQRTGVLYAGQEDVGIWRVVVRTGDRDSVPFYETRGSTASSFREPKSVISRDVEGLCIWYGAPGTAYLLASSQGGAHGDAPNPEPPYDDTFAVFTLKGASKPKLLGSFRVGAAKGIDAVQESDGADVISTALPGFPKGLFVTQDGYDDDLNGLSGEPEASNFKFVPWERIAGAFEPPLLIQPKAWDPRQP